MDRGYDVIAVRSNLCPHRLVVLQNFVIFQIRYPEPFRVVSGTICNGRRVSLGKNSGKILISTLVTHANVFLLDENRSGQFSKIMSKSFQFGSIVFSVGVSGRFSYLKIICTSIKIQISWCNRASFLPIFFL